MAIKDLDINFNTIAHEATHIRSHIYLSLGIDPDLEKDEKPTS